MGEITIAEVCDAIESTLSTATGIERSQSYDELTEGIAAADCPLLQVYWESFAMDPTGGTDRKTFGAGVRSKPFVVHADIYASRRHQLAQDNKRLIEIVDAVLDVLEEQDKKPYFGFEGIKSWSLDGATRTLFLYPDETNKFVGARFILTIWAY